LNAAIRKHIKNVRSKDGQAQNAAFLALMKASDRRVDWAYEVWDDLVQMLTDKDNHVRAIGAQVLCNLAISDPKGRMLKDFARVLAVTRDERFVTARHTFQAIWKVGLAGEKQRKLLLQGLGRRYKECAKERNTTLVRYDINVSLGNLYDVVKDEDVKKKALAWNETEPDLKYRKKYAAVWQKRT
jgi:HEAT repeat protein